MQLRVKFFQLERIEQVVHIDPSLAVFRLEVQLPQFVLSRPDACGKVELCLCITWRNTPAFGFLLVPMSQERISIPCCRIVQRTQRGIFESISLSGGEGIAQCPQFAEVKL